MVAPGYTDQVLYAAGGNPYGTSVTVDQDGKMIEDVKDGYPSGKAGCYCGGVVEAGSTKQYLMSIGYKLSGNAPESFFVVPIE